MPRVKLSELKNGQVAKVCELPREHSVSLRLQEMGMRVDTMVKLKKRMPLSGPLIITSGATEIAIGKDVANRIIVCQD